MSTIYNHAEYMEAMATNLKEIAHGLKHKAFAEASTINLFEGLTENLTSIRFPCLILIDDLTSRLYDRLSDNLLDVPYYQFAVLYTADINDTASHRKAREAAKRTAKKVLARMFRDQRDYAYGLTNLQRDGIGFDAIGPVGDGAYGCMVTFTIQEPAKIMYDPTDWIDG